MRKACYLVHEEHVPRRAKFPAIDAHNHLWGKWNSERISEVMDAVGVVAYCDVTANVKVSFDKGGYFIEQGDIDDFFQHFPEKYPGKFYCFTMAGFAKLTQEPLFDDPQQFVAETIEMLDRDVAKGARGLKVLKELGLSFKDAQGELVHADSPALFAIWEHAGDLGVPVLIHQSDPSGFFEPVTQANEHYESLKKFPSWSFADPSYPRKEDLLKRRDNLVKEHPNTTFILPHVANFAENLGAVSSLLDACPNVYVDFSARMDELGRQPYTSREFFMKYQDRILFGTDMPVDIPESADMYRSYFRFLETYDESFYAPDYDGRFERSRWPICGIGLPDDVLEKIYYKNALKIIPGLKQDLSKVLEIDD